MKKVFAALLFISISIPGYCQFYNSNFDYSIPVEDYDFLFSPTGFSSFGSGYTNVISGQFSGDIIHSIHLNPAQLTQKDAGYFYLDVTRTPKQSYSYPNYTYYGISPQSYINDYYYYNELNFRTREPLLSTAFFINPFNSSKLMLGVDYQLLNIHENFNQLYYPNYYYLDSMADFSSSSLSTRSDLLSGRDEMQHTGHFISTFASYALSNSVQAGLKVSYNTYAATGNMSSEMYDQFAQVVDVQPLDIYYYDPNYSLQRDISYNQWDVNTGVTVQTSEYTSVGLAMGFLVGDFQQNGEQLTYNSYSDFYHSDYQPYLDSNNLYTTNLFDKEGQTLYTNLSYALRTSANGLLTLNLHIARTTYELGYAQKQMASNGLSYIGEFYVDEELVIAEMISSSRQSSILSATGNNEEWRERFTLSLETPLQDFLDFTTGFQIYFNSKKETFTDYSTTLDTYKRSYDFEDITRTDSIFTSISDYSTTKNATTNRDRFSLQVPAIFDFHLLKTMSVKSGVIATFYSDIFNNSRDTFNRIVVYDQDGNWLYPESSSTNRYSYRFEDSQSHLQFIGAITYAPSNTVRLKFLSTSGRLDPLLDPGYSSEFTFKLALELNLR